MQFVVLRVFRILLLHFLPCGVEGDVARIGGCTECADSGTSAVGKEEPAEEIVSLLRGGLQHGRRAVGMHSGITRCVHAAESSPTLVHIDNVVLLHRLFERGGIDHITVHRERAHGFGVAILHPAVELVTLVRHSRDHYVLTFLAEINILVSLHIDSERADIELRHIDGADRHTEIVHIVFLRNSVTIRNRLIFVICIHVHLITHRIVTQRPRQIQIVSCLCVGYTIQHT